MSDVRVRFAPSPTGHLHIGGARTALFNWLFARNIGGKFILRIEDTDRDRSTDEYIESIMQGMRWLGLDWDEGPFRQTDRYDVYKIYLDKLMAQGMAYKCYCTPEELEARREQAMKDGHTIAYDRRCRDLKGTPPDRPASIRFKMPLEGQVYVNDLIKGAVGFENSQMDDLIIARSDGTPTYNFCVVVDDVDMAITHVIRGDDHLNNTPKQIHIYRALGYEVPVFAHLPMILGADKTRLSKRHGATSVMAYRDQGYLAHALVNYLVRLGWSHGDQEVFSRQELIAMFTFDNVGKSASVFNPEKLLWLNAEYIKSTPRAELCSQLMPFLELPEGTQIDHAWMERAVGTLVERAKTLLELASQMKFYLADEVEFDPSAKGKFIIKENAAVLEAVRDGLTKCDDFTHAGLEVTFKAITEGLGLKLGKVAQPVRVAVVGRTESPGIYDVLEVLGKERSLKRLDRAIEAARG